MLFSFFFFFNDTATTEIYTLSLHDALPIFPQDDAGVSAHRSPLCWRSLATIPVQPVWWRSEEHTSELQSPCNLVCRLLLEKKKKITTLQQACQRTLDHNAHELARGLLPILI